MNSLTPRRPHPAQGLTQRLRAIKDGSDGGSHTTSGSGMRPPDDGRLSSAASQSEDHSGDDNDDEEHEEQEASDKTIQKDMVASISFGALAKAQASLGKRKRSNDDDAYIEALGSFAKTEPPGDFINNEALERRAGKKDTRDFSRASKHAPAELSSKKAVSRKREVVPIRRINHRDPRFEPLSGAVDDQKTKKNYSFLDTYRDSETSELKSAIRKTKTGEGKEKLKRALLSMESRKKAQEMKEQQQEVLRRHRKEEKEKIEQGKRPFFLKKADQKQMALVKKFEGMKGKQVDKLIERRRKKKAAKERKGMPEARRG